MARLYYPHEAFMPMPNLWWVGFHQTGFDIWNDPAQVRYLRSWGVITMILKSGRGKPVQIQTHEEAEGNVNRLLVPKGSVLPEPLPRGRASIVAMGSGAGKPRKVIDNGVLKEYVGIGWIPLRAARVNDHLKYPCLEG